MFISANCFCYFEIFLLHNEVYSFIIWAWFWIYIQSDNMCWIIIVLSTNNYIRFYWWRTWGHMPCLRAYPTPRTYFPRICFLEITIKCIHIIKGHEYEIKTKLKCLLKQKRYKITNLFWIPIPNATMMGQYSIHLSFTTM